MFGDRGPTGKDRNWHQQRRQQHEPKADAVNCNMIAGADGRDPRIILFKSETAERAVARNQEEREQKDGRGKAERDPTMVRLFRSRGKTIDDGRSRTDYRQQNQNCEQMSLYSLSRLLSPKGETRSLLPAATQAHHHPHNPKAYGSLRQR